MKNWSKLSYLALILVTAANVKAAARDSYTTDTAPATEAAAAMPVSAAIAASTVPAAGAGAESYDDISYLAGLLATLGDAAAVPSVRAGAAGAGATSYDDAAEAASAAAGAGGSDEDALSAGGFARLLAVDPSHTPSLIMPAREVLAVDACLSDASEAQLALVLLASEINSAADSEAYESALKVFVAKEPELRGFNVLALNATYYQTLVEGVCLALSKKVNGMNSILKPFARTNDRRLHAARSEFDGLTSILDRLAAIYSESAFTFKEDDAPEVRAPHYPILDQIAMGYYTLHAAITPLYRTEVNEIRKRLLEAGCAYKARGSIAGKNVVKAEKWAQNHYQHALILGQLYQIPPYDTRDKYRKELVEIKRELRDNPKYVTGIEAQLSAMEALDLMDKYDRMAVTAKDPRHREIYLDNMKRAKAQLTEHLRIANSLVEGKDPSALLMGKVSLLNAKLQLHRPSLLADRHKISEPRMHDVEGLTLLGELENTLRDLIKIETPAVSEASAASAGGEITLLEVYRRYSKHIPLDYRTQIIENVYLQIRNGRFGEALERLKILKRIRLENSQEAGNLVEWTIALCQGYMGDWTPYNALRAAQVEIKAAASEAKHLAKASALEAAGARARAAQEAAFAARAEAERKALEAESARKARLAAGGGAAMGIKMSHEAELRYQLERAELARMREAEREEAVRERAVLSAKLAAEDARHAPAMAAKALTVGAAGGCGRADVVGEEARATAAATAIITSAAATEHATIDLRSLFKLTGTSKKVEEEIIGNTWRIKRNDLITYFKNLGCTVRETKGSHTMIELPEVTEILVNDQVVAVIPEEGGSRTLPNWEGDHVPPYLIPQVSRLRAILAESAVERATALTTAAASAAAALLEEEDAAAAGTAKGKGGGKSTGGKGGGKGGGKKKK